ncbi:hypothetical protein TNCT_459371 [Trichonephila clavata]|uniref:Uncharacterized protein n=1 Tax=Trichonephila clavata TaxID=2740835 RepID=A0A8X6LC10_TRICU|nr:hypothetical protein TNCT_459371 [Trichonephila clavata]
MLLAPEVHPLWLEHTLGPRLLEVLSILFCKTGEISRPDVHLNGSFREHWYKILGAGQEVEKDKLSCLLLKLLQPTVTQFNDDIPLHRNGPWNYPLALCRNQIICAPRLLWQTDSRHLNSSPLLV